MNKPVNKDEAVEFIPGDKIIISDIYNGSTRCTTDIYDIVDGRCLIDTPSFKGRLIRFDKNRPYNFIIQTENGMFSAWGIVLRQFKRGNFYLTEAKLSSHLTKYQRRKYYRLDCALNAKAIGISEKDDKQQINEAETLLANGVAGDNVVESIILNISGGGAYITCRTDLKDSKQIMIRTTLKSTRNGRQEYETMNLLADILEKIDNHKEKTFYYRLQFVFDDENEREKIIKYVLDEQIKRRKTTKN